ncbi:MAG: hypothetical protein LN410_00880 [Candidatus Thermoplasmatota archaeon]|nr:hypothetical protein [Candidatus Thermoplasmatota archaeon]
MTASRRVRGAGVWAILGGILLEVGHFSAVGFWESILSLLASLLPAATALIRALGLFVLLIASLGGLAAIVAGILFLRDHTRTGRLLIGFAVGFSLLSVLIYLITSILGRNATLSGNTLVVVVGLFLAIYARGLAKKGQPPGS